MLSSEIFIQGVENVTLDEPTRFEEPDGRVWYTRRIAIYQKDNPNPVRLVLFFDDAHTTLSVGTLELHPENSVPNGDGEDLRKTEADAAGAAQVATPLVELKS